MKDVENKDSKLVSIKTSLYSQRKYAYHLPSANLLRKVTRNYAYYLYTFQVAVPLFKLYLLQKIRGYCELK